MAQRGNIELSQLRLDTGSKQGVVLYGSDGNVLQQAIPNDATKYLDGTGAFSTPGGGSSNPSFFGLWNFNAPPTTGWSWDNQGTASIVSNAKYQFLAAPKKSAVDAVLYYRNAPSTPYSLVAAFFHDNTGAFSDFTSSNNQAAVGIAFRDSSGKITFFYFGTFATDPEFRVQRWTNSTTVGSALTTFGPSLRLGVAMAHQPFLMRLRDDGTDIYFDLSIDGFNWFNQYSESRTAFFASGPTQLGFGGYVNDTAILMSLVSWG